VKQLKSFLKDRGLECKGCSEKGDFISLAFENKDLPIKSDDNTKNPESPQVSGEIPPEVDKEKLEEIMAKLRQNGFGNSNFWSPNDFNNLTPEEIAAKVSLHSLI
jgi:hypothetical protein